MPLCLETSDTSAKRSEIRHTSSHSKPSRTVFRSGYTLRAAMTLHKTRPCNRCSSTSSRVARSSRSARATMSETETAARKRTDSESASICRDAIVCEAFDAVVSDVSVYGTDLVVIQESVFVHPS